MNSMTADDWKAWRKLTAAFNKAWTLAFHANATAPRYAPALFAARSALAAFRIGMRLSGKIPPYHLSCE